MNRIEGEAVGGVGGDEVERLDRRRWGRSGWSGASRFDRRGGPYVIEWSWEEPLG